MDVYVQTNDKVYHPKQTMEITVDVVSERNIGGAALRVYGLKKLSYYFLDRKESVDINIGVNRFGVDYTIPSCSACSGLDTGAYDINAEIEYVGGVIGEGNTSVEIR
ncbi:MAG: hypothetical protein U9M95_03665 [Candidatus Altiarchaeota archaeon]|nr:hypothetical protein [Candidatus Altiarchaeota archaeon]